MIQDAVQDGLHGVGMPQLLRRMLCWTLCVAAGVFLLWCGLNTPWVGDDVTYAYIFRHIQFPSYEENPEHIQSILDIPGSLWNHYFLLNGRFTAHALIQLFCGIAGQRIFAWVNVAGWAALALMVARASGISGASGEMGRKGASGVSRGKGMTGASGGWDGTLKSLLTLVGLMLLCFPTRMMPSTQISYIWMPALLLLFLQTLFNDSKRGGWLWLIGGFLFGMLTGNSQESFVVGAGGGMIYYAWRMRGKLTPMDWALGLGFAVGFLVMAGSPGAWGRASSGGGMMLNIKEVILHLRLFYLLLIVAGWRLMRRRLTFAALWRENSFWIIAIVCQLLFNLFVPFAAARQLFGVEFFSLVVLLRVLPQRAFSEGWLVVLWLLTLVCCVNIVEKISLRREQMMEIERQAEEGKRFVTIDLWNRGISLLPDVTAEIYDDYVDSSDYELTTLQMRLRDEKGVSQPFNIIPSHLVEEMIGKRIEEPLALRFDPAGERLILFVPPTFEGSIGVRRRLPFGLEERVSGEGAFRRVYATPEWDAWVLVGRSPLFTSPVPLLIHPDGQVQELTVKP